MARALWTCPRCGRRFAKRNQWHSCKARSTRVHLAGATPAVRALYRKLVAAMKGFGPLRIDAVQSGINLISTHHFGGVRVLADSLRLGFLADHRIEHPRVVHHEVVGPRRVGHRVLLRTAKDVDARLLGWLKEAYELQRR